LIFVSKSCEAVRKIGGGLSLPCSSRGWVAGSLKRSTTGAVGPRERLAPSSVAD
jgi:hypothetical protein